MSKYTKVLIGSILLFCACSHLSDDKASVSANKVKSTDNFLWLEDVEGSKALRWVKTHNEKVEDSLEKDPRYNEFFEKMKTLLNAEDRLPVASFHDGYLYLFWQDEKNIRGVWKRATVEEYLKPKINWEVVIDFDQLAKDENENWVYRGVDCNAYLKTRCLIKLSRGGKDAEVFREFDLSTRQFVSDGFNLPEAKSEMSWLNADEVLVSTDFGAGTLNNSGYPMLIKVWKRGQKLSDAQLLFSTAATDVWAYAYRESGSGGGYVFTTRGITFYKGETFVYQDDTLQNQLKIPLPESVDFKGVFSDQCLFMLRDDWQFEYQGKIINFKSGELLSFDLKKFLQTKTIERVARVFSPNSRQSVQDVSRTANALFITYLEDVSGAITKLTFANGQWRSQKLPLPKNGAISVVTDSKDWTQAIIMYESFLEPSQLMLYDGIKNSSRKIKTLPERFNAKGLQVRQYFVSSADKTRIPYYMVYPKNMKLDGKNKTLLYGYGGFEISMDPFYSGGLGQLWLEKGNVYVVAGIRGGGEYGPQWHQSAILENKQKSYDDFIAVAEDLIKKNVADSNHLAIQGGSNGGLLMGAVMTQRPELFKAVICQVPLLDMLRYHKLLAGASWMGEYGNPEDPKMREIILKYSPYHNLQEGVKYPRAFFLTSTKDDRVHPGHARKMVAKMEGLGQEVYYFENTEGGHAGAANRLQIAKQKALEYVYLYSEL